MRHSFVFAAALLLPAASAQADPPPLFAPNIPAYLQALTHSTDPAAKAIRQRIAAGPADLTRERALAEKDGIVTRADQLAQPLPPADKNAALLYTQLDALRKRKPLTYLPGTEMMTLRNSYSPAQISALQTMIEARPDIFALLHTAAAKPQCVFPSDPANPFDFPEEYNGMRENARELRLESTLLGFQGKYPEAADNQLLGFRLTAHATSAPKMIGFYVGSAIDAIAVTSLQDILARAGPNAALDRKVSADILALPPLSLAHVLGGEPARTDAEFAIFRHASPAELADALQLSGLQTAPPAAAFTPAEQAELNLLLDAAEADYLHQMRQIIPAADSSRTRHTVFTAAEARAEANSGDPIQTLSDKLNPVVVTARIMGAMPTLGGLEQQIVQVAARRLVAAAGASVSAAKAQSGAFPANLPAQFVDPFTTKPLGYRLEGTNGFVVYSPGSDGSFDGGKPGDKRDNRQVVFRYPLGLVP